MPTSLSSQLAARVFASPTDVFWLVDDDARIRQASDGTTAILGWAAGAIVARPLLELVHDEERDEVAAQLANARARPDEPMRFSFRCVDAEGGWRMLDAVARDAGADGVLLHARDVTTWAQLEAVLVESRTAAYELADARSQLVTQLRELDASRAQLTGRLVHDLKSPLTTVLMNARFIQQDLTDPTAVMPEAKAIERAADAIHRMIQDLLDVGTSEDGRLVAKPTAVALDELVAEVAATQDEPLRGRRQRLIARVDVASTVAVDRDLMSRVLMNLVDNCSKYARPKTDIELRAWRGLDRFEQDAVHVTVTDRGAIVPDAVKPKLFDLYARLDAHANARASRGVGLAFCRRAIEAHDGEIWVEDHPEGGCVFHLCWPEPTSRSP